MPPKKHKRKGFNPHAAKKALQSKAVKETNGETNADENNVVRRERGRQRIPNSLVALELNEKCLDYFLQDDTPLVIKCLSEMNKERKKMIFLSSNETDIEKFTQRIPYLSDVAILLRQTNIEEKRKEAMEAIMEQLNKKILPENSAYIGTLFEKKDLKDQPFQFGKVFTPLEFFTDSDPLAKLMAHESEEDKNQEDKASSRASRMNSPEKVQETENDEEPLEAVQENLNNQLAVIDKSQENSVDDDESMNELDKQGSLAYYSKIKELSSKISKKLLSKLDQIRIKRPEFEEIDDTVNNDLSQNHEDESQRKATENKEFEDKLFTKAPFDELKLFKNIFNQKDIEKTQRIYQRIKAIELEPDIENDTNPIRKKVKEFILCKLD